MSEQLDQDLADLVERAGEEAGLLVDAYEPFEAVYGTATRSFAHVSEGTQTSGLQLASTQAASSAR